MNKALSALFFVFFLSQFTASAGYSGTQASTLKTASPEYMRENYVKREVLIPMRDGVSLFTSIYEPRNRSVRHPVLMERTCYSVAPYGEDVYKDMENYLPYVEAGYILVFQDVRGRYESEGTFEHLRPYVEGKKLSKKVSRNAGLTDEASDAYDTVEWIVKNTYSNGCVGIKGVSYPGFYATMGALSGHPAVKAVSPQAPATDWFHGDDVHHNGALMMAEMASFLPRFEYPGGRLPQLVRTDIYSDYLRIGTFAGLCAEFADSVAYLRQIREHPHWDEYWESHTVTKGQARAKAGGSDPGSHKESGFLRDIKPALLIVGGFFDKEDCYGAFDTYKAVRSQSPDTELYLVMGPWYHGAWRGHMGEFWGNIYFGPEALPSYYMERFEYPFFAYYLEGKGDKPAPGAQVFDSGRREWVSCPYGWPQVGAAQATAFSLKADGSIGIKQASSLKADGGIGIKPSSSSEAYNMFQSSGSTVSVNELGGLPARKRESVPAPRIKNGPAIGGLSAASAASVSASPHASADDSADISADSVRISESVRGDHVVSYVSDPSRPVPYRSAVETKISRDYMTDDQRFAARRPDVACFSTRCLSEDMTLRGEVEVELYVDISTTDADFVVKLIDVFPDGFNWYDELGIPRSGRSEAEDALARKIPNTLMAGYQMLVRGDVMRGKYRESFSAPQPFEPGKITRVRFALPDVCHTFLAGHRLMIQIQSSWFPLVDRNPQTFCDIYTCGESAYQPSVVRIHCSEEAPSSVKLPLVL